MRAALVCQRCKGAGAGAGTMVQVQVQEQTAETRRLEEFRVVRAIVNIQKSWGN